MVPEAQFPFDFTRLALVYKLSSRGNLRKLKEGQKPTELSSTASLIQSAQGQPEHHELDEVPELAIITPIVLGADRAGLCWRLCIRL